MTENVELQASVPADAAGSRLDQVLAALFPEYSRSRLQQWVKAGQVTVDGRCLRPRDRMAGGESVRISATLEPEVLLTPEPIDLQVVYEDEDILIIDKPAGLVVHPGAGNAGGTLQNALLHRHPALETVPRCGIVHRLDKDTSGLLVVAMNLRAHASLVEQIQARTMGREYDALVNGTFTAGGKVEASLGRHPRDRKRMAVDQSGGGREAVTHYRIAERFLAHTLLRVRLETGRTHQIRVHMAWIRHPLVGDPVYAGRARLPQGADDTIRYALASLRRQALHAARLTLVHPATGDEMHWDAPRPADMESLLEVLRAHDQRMKS
ncbi:MAG: 23S rRNA pseudouridine(1911/1915/1917) synthase RluD [Aquisalimonadaceae bacterium]